MVGLVLRIGVARETSGVLHGVGNSLNCFRGTLRRCDTRTKGTDEEYLVEEAVLMMMHCLLSGCLVEARNYTALEVIQAYRNITVGQSPLLDNHQ